MIAKHKCKNFFLSIKEKLVNLRSNQTFLICCLLCVIYLISGYLKWLEIGVSLCALIFMAILPIQNAFCIFMFLHSFTLSNIGHDSCFMVTLIGFCLILLVKYSLGVKNGKYPYYKKLVTIISIFYLTTTAFSIFNELYRGAWLYFTYLPMAYFFLSMRKEFNIAQGMNFMFGGLITSCSLALISLGFPKFQYDVMFYNRFTAFINNPNYLYMRALFVLAYYMYRYANNKLSHFNFVLIFLTCSIITLSTLSKTAIVMLILITLVFSILFLKQDFKKRIKIFALFILALIAIILVCFRFIVTILDRFIDSFESQNFLNSLLTGRDEIWSLYFDAIFNSPWTALFGNGLLTKQVFVANQFGPTETHNFYIFLLYRFGILGTAFLGYIIYLLIKELKPSLPKAIAWLPLVFVLLESFCDNTMKCYNITYFFFAFMILFMECKKDEQTSQTTQVEKVENRY